MLPPKAKYPCSMGSSQSVEPQSRDPHLPSHLPFPPQQGSFLIATSPPTVKPWITGPSRLQVLHLTSTPALCSFLSGPISKKRPDLSSLNPRVQARSWGRTRAVTTRTSLRPLPRSPEQRLQPPGHPLCCGSSGTVCPKPSS